MENCGNAPIALLLPNHRSRSRDLVVAITTLEAENAQLKEQAQILFANMEDHSAAMKYFNSEAQRKIKQAAKELAKLKLDYSRLSGSRRRSGPNCSMNPQMF